MSTANLLGDSPLIGSNHLCYEPPLYLSDDETQDFLIFMITGNPGLISYYQPFLSTLHALLLSSLTSQSERFYIYGNSLTGFDASDSPALGKSGSLVGLKEQISNMENLLFQQINTHRKAAAAQEKPLKIILIGHSVGAYILLELISRHRMKVNEGEEDFDLIGGILLFPTITYLAQSPQGMIYSKILQIPNFAHIAGNLVKLLFFLVPLTVLCGIIKLVMRYPDHAAKTTAHFLKSTMGVRQALHLANDEMQTINEDKWKQEVWGAATSPGTNSRDTANSNLILYWGKNDKLVANHTRDELIAARGYLSSKGTGVLSKDWKPSMLIDENGIPHAFCLKHSETVAEKVKDWVEEIVEKHSRANPL